MTQVHWLDLSLIIAYLVGLIIFGIYISRGVKSGSDYFLAGKSLPFWVIGMSIIGTNIGSNDYVGSAGNAYEIGLAQANFEWIGAIPAMVLGAFLFLPYYWRAGVYSIPEYLGKRYDERTRFLSGIIFTAFSFVIVGVFLWATALMLHTYLGWSHWVGILVTGVVVGFYTISGGLKAVTYSDTVQLVIMFGGSLGVAYFGIEQAGGLDSFFQKLTTEHPDKLRVFLPADHPDFPWPGVLLGLAMVLSPAYWCANQAVLQRTLAARTQWDSQASMLFAAFAKTFIPLLIILPGFLVLVLSAEPLADKDQALPWIIKNVLPPGLSGLLFVAFIAALQSSVDSTLNSASTMFTRDIYGVWKANFRRAGKEEAAETEARESLELRMGRWVTFAGLIFGMAFAPVTGKFGGIYTFIQESLALFQGPVLAILTLGILSRRPTPSGGFMALLLGILVAALLRLGLEWNMLYVAFGSAVFSSVFLFVSRYFTDPSNPEHIQGLTLRSVIPASGSNSGNSMAPPSENGETGRDDHA
ncbi:MAG: sodium/solute symporter [Leptospiraceae bacterium]|nr:sodium/solute symporter [Leptospiraceae bacterium]